MSAAVAVDGLARVRRTALVVGVTALAAAFVGALVSPGDFFRAYLVGYLYWLGFALGALAIVLLHHLSGGAWGFVVRRINEAACATLPVLALLFVPLLFGLRDLYAWARPEVVAADPVLQQKAIYLNVPFFVARAVVYFATWSGVAWILWRWSGERDRRPDPNPRRYRLLAGPGLALYGLTVTFAAIDWAMSLDPHWYSTMYGLTFGLGQVLTAFAFGITIAVRLGDREPFARLVTPANLKDLGNLMLAFVMLWAYVSFAQYLLIYAANLREEVPWYLPRLHGGWAVVAILLIAFHFALPFVLLLSRAVKRNPTSIAAVAQLILVMRLVDVFWLVLPSAPATGSLVAWWLDVVTPLGIGGVWLAAFTWRLGARSLVPGNDPGVEEAMAHGH